MGGREALKRKLLEQSPVKAPNLIFLSLAILVGSAKGANADVIYNNGAGGPAGINSGWTSDDDAIGGSNNGRRVADEVVLNSPVTVTGIDWSGGYFNSLSDNNNVPAVDDFSIGFYGDDGGSPGSLIAIVHAGNAVNRADSGTNLALSTASLDIYTYSHQGFTQVLPKGTVWVAVFNNSTGTSDDWIWSGLTGAGGNALRENRILDGAPTWSSATGTHVDFRLHGTVVAGDPVLEISANAYNFTDGTSFPVEFPANPAGNATVFLQIYAGLSPP